MQRGKGMIDIDYIDDFMRLNPQFPDNQDDSQLWKSIKMALVSTDSVAQEAAKFHCNSMSFYALCRAHKWIMFHYSTWVQKLVANKSLDPKGWLYADKRDVAKLFGFDDKFNQLIYFANYDKVMSGAGLNPEKGYNIKVFSNSNHTNTPGKGDHFMAGYVLNGHLYLSDSGRRGIRVIAHSVIPRDKFQWAMEV
jgi:hypothetical protein